MDENAGIGDAIIEGAASVLWRTALEDAAAGTLPDGPLPQVAMTDARRIIGQCETAHEISVLALLLRAASADSDGDEALAKDLYGDVDYQRSFGECLAHMALGHGVSWFDEHAQFDLMVLPYSPADTVAAARAERGVDDAITGVPTA